MKIIKFLAIYFFLICIQYSAYAEMLTGKVISVSDGDTITVLDSKKNQLKIRLNGIDAPEKAQPFGQASKINLSSLVFSKEVDISWEKRDRFQRILGKVLLNGQDICLEQIKNGMAWHYRQYQRDQAAEDRGSYYLAEKDAREKRIGLWSDDAPIEPSQFRHKK